MERKIILNSIQTPDGTVLISRHRHDYVTYVDKNGHQYSVDGGNDYERTSYPKEFPPTNISIYSDAPFEVIRENYCRGGRGKDGTEPLTWVPISKMSEEWLENCITYNDRNGNKGCFANMMYVKEIDYRKEYGIKINEE